MAAAARDQALRQLLADPDQPYSEWFAQEHSPEAARQLALWRAGATRAFMEKMAEGMEPGGALFVLLRKRYIEDQVRAALDDGVRQMVILGAGYDPLGVRLAREREDLRVFELDHPATQAVKRRALERRQALPSGLALVSEDLLRGTLAQRLAVTAGYRPEARTVFVAEGVLMYLDAGRVDGLFAAVHASAPPASRFIFTVMDGRLLGDPASAAARTARFLALSGEPFRSSLDPTALEGFAAARGFRVLDRADGTRLRAAYVEPLGLDRPVGEGEWVAVTEMAGQPV